MDVNAEILLEIRASRAEMAELREDVRHLARRLLERDDRPEGERFCRAVLDDFGPSPFTAAELRDFATARSTRRPLLLAMRDLCHTGDCNPSNEQLGIALGNLAKAGAVVGRRTRYGKEWTLVTMTATTDTGLRETMDAP